MAAHLQPPYQLNPLPQPPPPVHLPPPPPPPPPQPPAAPTLAPPTATASSASSSASLLLHHYQQEARRAGEREFDAGVGERQRQQDLLLQRPGGAALARKRRKTRSAYVSRYAAKSYTKLLEQHVVRQHQSAASTRAALAAQSERHARARALLDNVEAALTRLRAGKFEDPPLPILPSQRSLSLDLSQPLPSHSLPLPSQSHALPIMPQSSTPHPLPQMPIPQLPRATTTSAASAWTYSQSRPLVGAGSTLRAPWTDVLDNSLNDGARKEVAAVSDVSGSEQDDGGGAHPGSGCGSVGSLSRTVQ